MLWTNLKRVIRSGFINFWRNGFVSMTSMYVMITMLFVLGAIIFGNALLRSSLDQIRSKVDINVYFVTNANENDILSIKKSLEALPEVAEVNYISRDDALEAFRARHENDQYMIQALDEVGDNPLGATLNIKAKDPAKYASISNFLESKTISQADGLPIVDKINYNQERVRVAIDRLTNIMNASQRMGLFLTIALILISILTTYNTIRLAIYVSREEISVMQLVGASNKYVRGPFIVIGIMYGIISAIITIAIYYPLTYYLGKSSESFFGINLYNYYILNFGYVFLILLAAGVVIGALSSFLAIRRYLKV